MNKEIKYGVWQEFFNEEFSQEKYNALSEQATHRATVFMQAVRNGEINITDDLTPFSQDAVLDRWVAENDELLAQLVHDIQSHILSAVEFSLPAHDERQILFKDASEGLRFYQMEKPEGYKSTFVIPMFAHDIGRLLEGRMFHPDNPHDHWTPHSRFSFMMLQDILEQPQYVSVPKALKDHYLYAVLSHSGDNGESYMSRAVQTCDRMQLIGAEGFYRALSYGTCLMNADIKYPDNPSYQTTLPNMFEHRSVISILEYCSRNMRENIGESHAEWQRRIAVENIVLLLAYCDGNEELMLRVFAPELDVSGEYGPKKGQIEAGLLKDAYALYAKTKYSGDMRWSPYEIASAAVDAIQGPIGAAQISPALRQPLMRAVLDMSEIERQSLFRTMMMATQFRLEQDDIDLAVCREAENDAKRFIRTIAVASKKYAAPSLTLTISDRPPEIAVRLERN